MGLDAAHRHAFLCIGPECCIATTGSESWDRLKARIKEKGLPVLRSKAACLRICSNGPWMVVYPEGVWYGSVTAERCERIVDEHLGKGRPVTEWIARTHPLA